MTGFFYTALCICFVLPAHAVDNLDTLETLLTELRKLRETKYQAINGWKDEKQQLNLLIVLEGEKADNARRSVDVSARQKSDLAAKKLKVTEDNQSLEVSINTIEEWIDRSCLEIWDSTEDKQILFDSATTGQLRAILDESLSVTDKLVQFLNLLQTSAINGTRAIHSTQVIETGGTKYSADVLSIGGVLEYFVTPDDKTCGVRTASHSTGDWTAIKPAHAPWIRKAIRILNKDIPAELVTVPVPLPAE